MENEQKVVSVTARANGRDYTIYDEDCKMQLTHEEKKFILDSLSKFIDPFSYFIPVDKNSFYVTDDSEYYKNNHDKKSLSFFCNRDHLMNNLQNKRDLSPKTIKINVALLRAFNFRPEIFEDTDFEREIFKTSLNGYFELAKRLESIFKFHKVSRKWKDKNGNKKESTVIPISNIIGIVYKVCQKYPDFTEDLFLHYITETYNFESRLKPFFDDDKFQALCEKHYEVMKKIFKEYANKESNPARRSRKIMRLRTFFGEKLFPELVKDTGILLPPSISTNFSNYNNFSTKSLIKSIFSKNK